MKQELKNEYAYFEKRDNDDISGRCLRDQNNLPSCFNKTKRSIKKAWVALEKQWTDNTTMYEACEILSLNGIRMHTYCAMD